MKHNVLLLFLLGLATASLAGLTTPYKSSCSIQESTQDAITIRARSAQGGISETQLETPSGQARQLEFSFAANIPGHAVLNYTIQDTQGSRTLRAEHPRSVIPDGTMRPMAFRLDQAAGWVENGLITEWKLDYHASRPGAVIRLAQRRFLATPNLIAAADTLPAGPLYLDDLKPRGRYRLEWQGSRPSTPPVLRFLDFQLQELPGTLLTMMSDTLEFTAPEHLVRAVLELPEATRADSYPRLELLAHTWRFQPKQSWRGQWIWDSLDALKKAQPFSYVWFHREFNLDDEPEYGAIAFMGDDVTDVFLNKKHVGYAQKYSNPSRAELTGHLKKGRNSLDIRVYNGTDQAGLCADVYVRAGDKDIFLCTDNSWQSHFGGKEKNMPQEFSAPAVSLGSPATTPPWAPYVRFRYAGPRGRLKPLSLIPGELKVEVLSPPPVEIESISLRQNFSGGDTARFTQPVKPSCAFTPGAVVTLTYTPPLPAQAASTIFLDDDYLELIGNPPLMTLDAMPTVQGDFKQARLTGIGGRTAIEFGGRMVSPTMYLTSDWDKLAPALESGLRNFRVITTLYDFWKAEDKYDFSGLEQNVGRLLAAVPDAVFLLDIRFYMPEWWLKQNPDDTTQYFEGTPRNTYHDLQALASKKWLADTDKPLQNLLAYIKTRPWAERIWGASIGESRNSEWFWGFIDQNKKRVFAGYSPGDLAAFRARLKRQYGTDQALQTAWRQPEATLATATMPDPARALHKGKGILLDPKEDTQLMDWFAFRNDALAEAILHFAHAIKQGTDGKWLCGAYYGYWTELSSNSARCNAHHGHNGFHLLLDSPDIDFLRAPGSYHYRKTGMPNRFMIPEGTCAHHGKLVYLECDERNSFGPHEIVDIYTGRPSSNIETVGHFNREFGMALTSGHALYWMDHPKRSLYEKPISDIIRMQEQVRATLPPVQGLTPVQVAVVGDRESIYYCATATRNVFESAIDSIAKQINYLAFPYSVEMVDDLLRPSLVPPRKLYIFYPTLVLSQERRTALMERLQREHASALWLYAAGSAYPGETPSAESCGDFLKLECRREDTPGVRWLTYGGQNFASDFRYGPWFYPTGGYDRVLAKNEKGKPVVVAKTIGECTHYFSAMPDLPQKLLDDIAAEANVFRYSSGRRDPLWIGNDLVFLTAVTSGEKRLATPDGRRLHSIIGPLAGRTLAPGEPWQAVSGLTYGFLLK